MIQNFTFSPADLPKIFVLAFLEIILSMDNAIVLGLIVARLPKSLKTRALWVGSISAFFIRALTLLIFSIFIQYRWIQIIGALYLFYLSISYFFKKNSDNTSRNPIAQFWKAVILVEFFDLIFAIDSILAGFAFIADHNPNNIQAKIWIVYFGGMIGLLAVRYGAHIFSKLVSKNPRLELSAHLMIGWISLKLLSEVFITFKHIETIFWIGLILTFFLGLTIKHKHHE